MKTFLQSWKLKAITQKTLCLLPFSYKLNYLLQRYITVGNELPNSLVLDRIAVAQKHIDLFDEYGEKSIETANILEIGTGWYPIVPIVFFLSGANDIETSDIRTLFNKDSINKTIRVFINLHKIKLLSKYIPNYKFQRINKLSIALNESEIYKKLKILNITSSRLLDYVDKKNIDLITSNNTFEFIEENKLPNLLRYLSANINDRCILSIQIDLTDEFSHFDRSIGNFNFLKFSKFEWKLITCKLNSTNQLRLSDFKNILKKYFLIIHEECIRSELDEIQNIKIHKSFSTYHIFDLIIKNVHLALKKTLS